MLQLHNPLCCILNYILLKYLQPKNPCFERGPTSNAVDPRKWQPAMVNKAGIRTCQKFVTPQHGRTKGTTINYPKVHLFRTLNINLIAHLYSVCLSFCFVAYSYSDVNQFVSKPHGRLLEGPQGQELYRKTTDETLEISATLNDEKKV